MFEHRAVVHVYPVLFLAREEREEQPVADLIRIVLREGVHRILVEDHYRSGRTLDISEKCSNEVGGKKNVELIIFFLRKIKIARVCVCAYEGAS